MIERATGLGVYIHVPFCDGKCPYCDFYSLRGDETLMERYVSAVSRAMGSWAERHGSKKVKSVYFGGGTPNLLGAARLSALLSQVKEHFDLAAAAEITLEANPTELNEEFFHEVSQAGFNRLSMGMQSAWENELALLGRKHSANDVEQAVKAARAGGFQNISLDLMLGLPGGSCEKLRSSAAFAAGLGVEHISAYILKVEEGTPFAARGIEVPSEDETADQYLFLVQALKELGYEQYEISNFSKAGKESRHNLVYWHGEEYLGFGPGAHSFYQGKRFYYSRDIDEFLREAPPVPDGEGGGLEEYAMLNLRLTEGLQKDRCAERFGPLGSSFFEEVRRRAEKIPPGLLQADGEKVSFTPEGFLVSNALLLKLLEG